MQGANILRKVSETSVFIRLIEEDNSTSEKAVRDIEAYPQYSEVIEAGKRERFERVISNIKY